METIYQFNNLSLSTKTAITSFIFGTVIFVLYILFPYQFKLIQIGIIYITIALIINGIVFLNLLYNLFMYPENRKQTAVQIMLLLANIPIALLYFFMVISGINLHSNF